MKEIGLGLAGLGMLYLTRRKMTLELGRLVSKFGGGQRVFVWLWSLIFLPGTIVHEMSHFFAAAVTGTRIGRVEIFPELPRLAERDPASQDNDKRSVHLGYVQTQELGLIRGFVVGTAPLFVGLGLMVWLANSMNTNIFIADAGFLDRLSSLGMTGKILSFAKIYLFFTVANSLFLSWADMKQALPLAAVAAILGGGLYWLGLRPEFIPDSRLIMLLNSLWKALAVSAGVNLAAVIIMWSANGMLGRLRGFRGI